jgi:hypothetical protein
MTARKTRPARGTLINEDMTMRDVGAALGVSTAWLSRCKRLATVPEEQFEKALKSGERNVEAIIRGAPVPAPGRVDRAKGLFYAMNATERASFIAWLKVRAAA